MQLFEVAGFTVNDGKVINRCGGASSPRLAFIDLNDDGRAEAHVADVDPGCYRAPGAYFAILSQQDGNWRRLIAEDGIVGFTTSRTAGWNDLSLDAQDSACPGIRRFGGADYGSTACGLALTAPAIEASVPASAEPQVGRLTGTRVEQLAQMFRNIVGATRSRSWEAVIAAFPGARWERRASQAADWFGATNTQTGSVAIDGASYHIYLGGTADRIVQITLHSPGDDTVEWSPIEGAIRTLGMEAQNVGCHSPTGFGWVKLNDNGQSAVLHKFVNYGTMVPGTDVYDFALDSPFDGRTEAQVAADRSLC